MPVSIRIATRDWDYLTPLILGDVSSPRVAVEVERVATLIPDLATDSNCDAAEVSFSRYVSTMAAGADSIVGVPCFIMRGFRHRCIITAEASPLERLSDLAGKRIGLTGWRDSGNTWTRAALRRAGVGVEDAYWFAGRLTSEHPISDRLDGFGRRGRIEVAPGERPMMELLAEGQLDAVFTPFMPGGFFGPASGFRQLLRDFRAAERAYFEDVGYVPGMHLVAVKASVVEHHPWLPQELARLIDESQRVWTAKRRKYAETSPWIIEELLHAGRDLPPTWNDSGLAANRRMIDDFVVELHIQGIVAERMSAEALFPFEAKSRATAA
ncbi:nitrate ABC transporter substrate-binding protein [Mesorhizobium sp. M00.F.Ca.ET.216.01.1.1]|uniref:nitrate ABC transporter substrate-binding protein n=1 Tax=Mesorhizobium sp. M00.F.Ca.ET.216.01.1.1 TaxID=2500528 RepID=UPI000FDB8F87|nr:nitrate ABC transporter substrate-binding protein [Mesorhizobium sp. M00.F.Ca.ET.216.01.1.1]TGQ46927.1 nitrate ABC transporter substrate-binding protein [Mesorhizobium sp. M00.F.Ca.ET.216.01.1.1]TJW12744.1 MAG: nitrate ABC transporter substrate-binding protein [Mesorhizobium sp.]TJW41679.1 MAG: nitrate ABC transporter substrate-binding protein [Mesorhizobium sp.]